MDELGLRSERIPNRNVTVLLWKSLLAKSAQHGAKNFRKRLDYLRANLEA
jgi:hypothetical protein